MNSGDGVTLEMGENGIVKYSRYRYNNDHNINPELEIVSFKIDSISSIKTTNYFDNIDEVKSVDALTINPNNRIKINASLTMVEEKYSIYSFKDLDINKANIEKYELVLVSCDEESQISNSHWVIDEKTATFFISINADDINALIKAIEEGAISANICLAMNSYTSNNGSIYLIGKSSLDENEKIYHKVSNKCLCFNISYTSKTYELGEPND
ncbi:hypothetical protein RGL88_000384 [Providencia rettgeri]|nr:hypothetical protein [Providencia rettgeri]